MKPIILGSFVPSPVMADIASLMDVDDTVKLSLASPRANAILSSYRSFARGIASFGLCRKEIYARGLDRTLRTLPLDDNVELAHKQILRFLSTVNEVTRDVNWDAHDIDDEITTQLLKIVFKDLIWISHNRITASIGKFNRLLARNKNKLLLWNVFVPTSFITNEVLSLLYPELLDIRPLFLNDGVYDQISTKMTDDFLKSPYLKKHSYNLRGFLNLHLTFPAILRLFQEIVAEDVFNWEYQPKSMPSLGTIGYQEMPAVLQYYNRETWNKWETTICNVNNNSYLEFDDIFTREEDSATSIFGISLDRNSTGPVQNAIIPEEFVNADVFQKFKGLTKDLKSETPIESVVPNRMRLDNLRVYIYEGIGHNYLEIHATIPHPPNTRDQECQKIEIVIPNVDQSTAEDIIAKLLKACSSINYLTLESMRDGKFIDRKIAMTDRLFSNIMKHAPNTRIRPEWFMEYHLSSENLGRLREIQTPALQKPKIEGIFEGSFSSKLVLIFGCVIMFSVYMNM